MANKDLYRTLVDGINDFNERLVDILSGLPGGEVEAELQALKGVLDSLVPGELGTRSKATLDAAKTEVDQLVANPPASVVQEDLQKTQILYTALFNDSGAFLAPPSFCFLPGPFVENPYTSWLHWNHNDPLGLAPIQQANQWKEQIGTSNSGKLEKIEFFSPALALIVRAPSGIHHKIDAGLITGDAGTQAIITFDSSPRQLVAQGQEVDFSDFLGLSKVTAEGSLAATVIQARPGEFVTLPIAPAFIGDLSTSSSQPVSTLPAQAAELEEKLYFAQFGDGDGLFSQIVLMNLDDSMEAGARIVLKNDNGEPLAVDLNGAQVTGELDVVVPAGGIRTFRTDGEGDLTVGSVTVCSNKRLAGVILFAGAFGVAGVGSSEEQPLGFLAPVEADDENKINTGIAAVNLENEEVTVELQLCNPEGQVLATTQIVPPAMGHRARFVNELAWDPAVDLTDFRGLLKATVQGDRRIAATVIQTRPNQFSTNPVAPLPPQSIP